MRRRRFGHRSRSSPGIRSIGRRSPACSSSSAGPARRAGSSRIWRATTSRRCTPTTSGSWARASPQRPWPDCNETEWAQTLYRQLQPLAGRHAIGHAEGSIGAVDRYLGLLAASLDRLDDAARHLEDAVHINERMGARPWTAHSRFDLATVLDRRDAPGDRPRAADLSSLALAAARDLGMPVLESRILAAESGAPRPASDGATGTFRHEGDYWTIAFEGDGFRIKDSKGIGVPRPPARATRTGAPRARPGRIEGRERRIDGARRAPGADGRRRRTDVGRRRQERLSRASRRASLGDRAGGGVERCGTRGAGADRARGADVGARGGRRARWPRSPGGLRDGARSDQRDPRHPRCDRPRLPRRARLSGATSRRRSAPAPTVRTRRIRGRRSPGDG